MPRPYEVEVRGADKSRQTFRQVKNNIDDIEKGLAQSARRGRQVTDVFKGMTLSRIAVDAVYRLKEALQKIVQMGFDYNKSVESSRLGIASLLTSQLNIVDAQGKALAGADKFNAAQQLTGKIYQQIEAVGLRTTATTRALVEAFQQSLGAATAAGLSWQESLKTTYGLVQAAKALGMADHQVNEEVRSILEGTINMNSRVAKTLGITNEMVKSWKEAGNFAEKLAEKTAPFAAAGDAAAQTWSGFASNLEEAVAKVSGALTHDIFEDMKRAMAGIQSSLIVIGEDGAPRVAAGLQEAKEIVDDFWQSMKNLWGAFKDLGIPQALLSTMKSILEVSSSIGKAWTGIAKDMAESGWGKAAKTAVSGIADGWRMIADTVHGVAVEGKGLEQALVEAGTATERIQEATKELEETGVRTYPKISQALVQSYREAYTKALGYLEKEKDAFRRLEEEKIKLTRRRADIQESMTERELALKRRLADFDKDEARLKRELKILQGKRGPLTEEERKKERIADIEGRLSRLQEDRTKAQEDHVKETQKAQEELAKLERQGGELAKKYQEAKRNIQLVEKSLEGSSQGALEFNEGLSKTVITANQLARNLIAAGKAISAYNAQLPEALKKEQAFDWTSLERELQAPMQKAAEATSQTQAKMKAIGEDEIPKATRALEAKERTLQRINSLYDEQLEKVERIRYAVQEWGFKIEGQPPHSGGEYAPGY